MQMEKQIHKREKKLKVKSFFKMFVDEEKERSNIVIHVRFANKKDWYQYFLYCVHGLSHDPLYATPKTVVHQAPLSIVFSRQEYWSG